MTRYCVNASTRFAVERRSACCAEPGRSQLRRRESEQGVDSSKYVARVRDLINGSIDRIAAADREREDALQRWRLPEALVVCEVDSESHDLRPPAGGHAAMIKHGL